MLDMMPAGTAKAEGPEQPNDDLGRKQRWFRAYEANKAREMREQRLHRAYYHDMQWTDAEQRALEKRGQQATVRNRIKRKVDFLVGVEQRLRRDPKAYPRTPKHEKDADVATAALRFSTELNRWDKVSSDVMHDGLVSGIGVAFCGIENGDPVLRHVPVDRFFYDPRSVQPDFSDARYLGLHLWMDVDEAKAKWPDQAENLEAMVSDSNVATSLLADADKETQWGDFEHRRVRIVEFWEKKARPEGGDGWYFCYFTGAVTLESSPSPYTGEKGEPDVPYIAWSPYVDHRGDRYGLVRTMRSIQDEINYAASKILHRIAVDRTYSSTSSVSDPDEFKRQMARPDGHVQLESGEWGKDAGIVDSGVKIQGEVERFNMSLAEIENLGPNPGLVGKGEGVDGASGRALLAQRDSGMTELSPIFERHRDWKLRVYRGTWQRCRQAWTAEKWIRITDDEEAVQFVGLNQYKMEVDPISGMPRLVSENVVANIDVDIILSEGPDTITMQEELLQTLAQVGEAAAGPLGRILIELSNAPNKDRLLQMLDRANAPDPAVAEMQRRLAELEEKLQAAEVDKKVAETENKRADTLQKIMTAMTPPQQPTDEFGNPSGPPPEQPDIMSGLAALSMFPLQYGQPTMFDMSMMAGAGGPPMPPQGGPAPEAGPPPNMPMDQGMPQPEQMGPGGLPVDAGA